jgi:hypothetical protein
MLFPICPHTRSRYSSHPGISQHVLIHVCVLDTCPRSNISLGYLRIPRDIPICPYLSYPGISQHVLIHVCVLDPGISQHVLIHVCVLDTCPRSNISLGYLRIPRDIPICPYLSYPGISQHVLIQGLGTRLYVMYVIGD